MKKSPFAQSCSVFLMANLAQFFAEIVCTLRDNGIEYLRRWPGKKCFFFLFAWQVEKKCVMTHDQCRVALLTDFFQLV